MWNKFEDIPGVSRDMAERLRRAGIETPRELFAMSRRELLKIIKDGLPEARESLLSAWRSGAVQAKGRQLLVDAGKRLESWRDKIF